MCGLVLFVAVLPAQEGIQRRKIKKLDVDVMSLSLTVGGKDIALVLTEKTQVLGTRGKDLKERLQAFKAMVHDSGSSEGMGCRAK